MRAIMTFLACLLMHAPAAAQVLIRSDLPLFTNSQADQIWPKNFYDEDSFGCSSKIAFGDYSLTETGDKTPSGWWKIENYGVMHCAYMIKRAGWPEGIEGGVSEYGWLIDLGVARTASENVDLFAFQIGASGGSEYVLLSRSRGAGWKAPFVVLDPTCPRNAWRETEAIDVWGIRYCAINDRRLLDRLARQAALRPAIGTLNYIESNAGVPSADH